MEVEEDDSGSSTRVRRSVWRLLLRTSLVVADSRAHLPPAAWMASAADEVKAWAW